MQLKQYNWGKEAVDFKWAESQHPLLCSRQTAELRGYLGQIT